MTLKVGMNRTALAAFQKHLGNFTLWALLCLTFGSTALAQSYNTTSTGQQIGPDATCGTANELNLPIVVPDTFTVSDLNLGFQATTTYRGDLRIRLTSPSATTVELVTQNGGVGLDNYNIELDDNPANDVINTGAHNTADGTTAPPYENLVRTNNAGGGGLSAFTGEPANGTWNLNVCDAFNVDQGNFGIATLYFSSPTDADLSLTASTSNTLPQDGDTITLTYNLINSGANTTSGVTVDIDLPAFLDFTSASGTGTYDEISEVWTIPGTVPVGTTQIALTVDVISVGSGAIISEVLTSAQSDSDSTPGNSVSTEDDYNSLSIFVQPPPTPPALSCPAVDQFTHAWTAPGTTNGWTSGNTAGSYTAGGIPLVFAVTGDIGNAGQISGVDAPVTQNTYTGGVSPAEYSLGFAADHDTNAQELVLTADIDDGTGVQALQFTVFDIDLGGWVDRLTVTGELNGTTVFPTLTPSARNFISGNSAIGQGGNAGVAEASGNVIVTFNSPIDKVTIVYGNDPSVGANPAFQIMAVHEMTMCPRLLADLTAVKSVEVYDPASAGLYMTPGNEVLYKITVNNSATANADATDIDLSDTLPENVRFVSATTTGFTGGAFGSPPLPAANTDCVGGACVIRYSGATLPINSTGEIQVRALIK